MFLLMLLIAVPVGIALAIAIDLADSRGRDTDSWIEDAHPVFARPAPDVTSIFDVARSRVPERRAGVRAARTRASARPAGAARRPQHRRQALPLH